MKEVYGRYQTKDEPVIEYVKDMLRKFQRMNMPPSDFDQFTIIKSNLYGEYILQLATTCVKDIDELVHHVRNIEAAKDLIRLQSPREAPSTNTIDEEQALDDMNKERVWKWALEKMHEEENIQLKLEQQEALERSAKQRRKLCYNCRRANHRYQHCPRPIGRLFCHRCGADDTDTLACPNCINQRKAKEAKRVARKNR